MRHTAFKRLTASLISAVLAIPSAASVPVMAQEESAQIGEAHFKVHSENLAENLTDVHILFDDQDKAPVGGDPAAVSGDAFEQTQRKSWTPTWKTEFGPSSFYMEFDANYVITDICFLDMNNVSDWTVEVGTPFNWTQTAAFSTDAYQVWRRVEMQPTAPTRYLRFSTLSPDTGVSEIAVYGYKESELTPEQTARTAPKPRQKSAWQLTAGGSTGFNAFIDDPMTAIMAAGNVREYHNFSWLIDENYKVKFTQGTWGDMDSYYSAIRAQNIDIIPCFQGGSSYIRKIGDSVPEIPIKEGADPLDPASYAIHAQAMYQVAARYGSNAEIDPATLNVAEGSTVKTGLGLLHALENSNEPNKNWSGKNNYFSPYELAAMCSADYDGHEGTIPNAGVKKADPDFQLAVGGLLWYSTLFDYLDAMKTWFDYNRTDGVFAVDIINVHLGPDTYNPEDSRFVENIEKLKDWMAENAPGTQLWISEYEIPMGDCETEGVDNHENENYQLRYAQRIARTSLLAMGAGVDRLTKFQLRDEGEGVYYNSGIVTQKGSWHKKKAWYALSCMTNILENANFTSAQTHDDVLDYGFTDQNGDQIHALWLPSSTGAQTELTLPAEGYAYLTEVSDYAEGTTSALTVKDGKVSVTVGEMPVFVTLSRKSKTIINGKGEMIRPVSISLESGESTDLTAAPENSTLNQFYRMFDEPQTMPHMIYGDTDTLDTPQTNVNGSGITAYIDLDKAYVLSGVGVFDTYGSGGISIYDADRDTLLWHSDLGSYMAKNLGAIDESAPVRRLKIVKEGGDLNELALYGYAAPEEAAAFDPDVNQDGRVNGFDMGCARLALLDGTFKGEIADAVCLQAFLLGNQK